MVVSDSYDGSRLQWRLMLCERCLRRASSLSWHYFRDKRARERAVSVKSAGASSAALRTVGGGSGAPAGA